MIRDCTRFLHPVWRTSGLLKRPVAGSTSMRICHVGRVEPPYLSRRSQSTRPVSGSYSTASFMPYPRSTNRCRRSSSSCSAARFSASKSSSRGPTLSFTDRSAGTTAIGRPSAPRSTPDRPGTPTSAVTSSGCSEPRPLGRGGSPLTGTSAVPACPKSKWAGSCSVLGLTSNPPISGHTNRPAVTWRTAHRDWRAVLAIR